MAIYKTKRFISDVKKLNMDDETLKTAAAEVLAGHFEADLGGCVIKKRVPLGKGKSGGARTIIFFKQGAHLFFYDCWAKNAVKTKGSKEIPDNQLQMYKELADVYLGMLPEQLDKAIQAGLLKEVKK